MMLYDEFVRDNWNRRVRADVSDDVGGYEGLRDLFIMTSGIGGECGEVQELVKKYIRDGEMDQAKLGLEIGDAIHYLTRLAHRFGMSLELVLQLNTAKLNRRYYAKKDPVAELHLARERIAEYVQRFGTPVKPKPEQFDIGDTYDHDRTCPGD